MKIPTLRECEKAVGEPASAWVARCYEIACKIVDARLVSRKRGLGGEAVYGHWLGPVSPRSHFANRRQLGFVPHGWIYVEAHNLIIDPTRWVFEAKTPYLYVEHEPDADELRCKHCLMLPCEHDGLGANDECGLYEPDPWPYDEGGNKWREAVAFNKPPPTPKKTDAQLALRLDDGAAMLVAGLLGQKDGRIVTAEQIFYLANLPYATLARGGIREIYDAICDAGSYFIEFIPIDNRNKARREAGFERK